MKKITFPLLTCLFVLLLTGCGEYTAFHHADSHDFDHGAVPLSSTPEGEETENTVGQLQPGEEPRAEKIPMVMAGGELYCDTGAVSDQPRCGMMDGQISSSVEPWQRPSEDGQSNFGSGYGYQSGPDGTIEINIDGQWHVFQLRSKMRVRYFDGWFDAADVSDETLRWLLWFNSLDPESQLAVSFVPLDLYELCDYPNMDEIAVEDAGG